MELQIGTIFKNKFHIASGSAPPSPTQLQILGAHLTAKPCVYGKEAYKIPTKVSFNREMCVLLVCYAVYGANSLPMFWDGNYYPGTNDIIGAYVPWCN